MVVESNAEKSQQSESSATQEVLLSQATKVTNYLLIEKINLERFRSQRK